VAAGRRCQRGVLAGGDPAVEAILIPVAVEAFAAVAPAAELLAGGQRHFAPAVIKDGAAGLDGQFAVVAMDVDAVAARGQEADLPLRRGDDDVVDLVAVENADGQTAVVDANVDPGVVDNRKLDLAVVAKPVAGRPDPDFGPATLPGLQDGAAADRPVQRGRFGLNATVGPKKDLIFK
jgi:hypothetical protein